MKIRFSEEVGQRQERYDIWLHGTYREEKNQSVWKLI